MQNENLFDLNNGITHEETTPKEKISSIDVTLKQIERDNLIQDEMRKIIGQMSEEFEMRDDEINNTEKYNLRFQLYIKSKYLEIKKEATKLVEARLEKVKVFNTSVDGVKSRPEAMKDKILNFIKNPFSK